MQTSLWGRWCEQHRPSTHSAQQVLDKRWVSLNLCVEVPMTLRQYLNISGQEHVSHVHMYFRGVHGLWVDFSQNCASEYWPWGLFLPKRRAPRFARSTKSTSRKHYHQNDSTCSLSSPKPGCCIWAAPWPFCDQAGVVGGRCSRFCFIQ